MKKIILDLCGGTGSWSLPYEKSQKYQVFNLTLPEWDIRRIRLTEGGWIMIENSNLKKTSFQIMAKDVYGIFAAPPCTQFSFARTNAKIPRNLREGMEIVNKCLEIIQFCLYEIKSDQQKYPALKFWALENPYYGMLRWFLGKPAFVFDPWEFGDAYKKRTSLWGNFNEPKKLYTNILHILTQEQINKHKTNSQSLPKFDQLKTKEIHADFYGKFDRQTRRAITPKGFAEAFFKAND